MAFSMPRKGGLGLPFVLSGFHWRTRPAYPSAGSTTVPASNLRWFKVRYAVADRNIGCKKFKLS